MQSYPEVQGSIKSAYLKIVTGILFLATSQLCFAETVVINGNKVISTRTVYENVDLDMANGRFTVMPGGQLIIRNSVVNATISPANPYFAQLNAGRLSLRNNKFNVATSGITPDSSTRQPYQLIHIVKGDININRNDFAVTNAFSVGFLDTQDRTTTGISVTNNTIKNFHGGIYLINSDSPEIRDNEFESVSYANIFVNGHLGMLQRNTFTFPGNFQNGDAIDIVNADGITIADNIIASSSGYGIHILGGVNIFIDNNKITDGKSYGIFIETPSIAALKKQNYLPEVLTKGKVNFIPNYNISIANNYISLNRYGLAGGVVNGLNVNRNTFIQRFDAPASRKFWTDNAVLLPQATDVNWVNNLYKEAFTQEVPGNNINSLKFVLFPVTGGVVFS